MVVSLTVPMGRALSAEHDHTVAIVHIAGSVQASDAPLLATTAWQLAAMMPQTLFVDLQGVTNAEKQLTHFLAQIATNLPRSAVLVLCAARPAIRLLIHTHCPALSAHLHDVSAPYRPRLERQPASDPS